MSETFEQECIQRIDVCVKRCDRLRIILCVYLFVGTCVGFPFLVSFYDLEPSDFVDRNLSREYP